MIPEGCKDVGQRPLKMCAGVVAENKIDFFRSKMRNGLLRLGEANFNNFFGRGVWLFLLSCLEKTLLKKRDKVELLDDWNLSDDQLDPNPVKIVCEPAFLASEDWDLLAIQCPVPKVETKVEKFLRNKLWMQSGIAQIFDGFVTLRDALKMQENGFDPASVCVMASLGAEKALKGAYVINLNSNLNKYSIYKRHFLLLLCDCVFPQESEMLRAAKEIDDLGRGIAALIAFRYPFVHTQHQEAGQVPFSMATLPMVRFTAEMAFKCVVNAIKISERCQAFALETIYAFEQLNDPIHFLAPHEISNIPYDFQISVHPDLIRMRLFRQNFAEPFLIEHIIGPCCRESFQKWT